LLIPNKMNLKKWDDPSNSPMSAEVDSGTQMQINFFFIKIKRDKLWIHTITRITFPKKSLN